MVFANKSKQKKQTIQNWSIQIKWLNMCKFWQTYIEANRMIGVPIYSYHLGKCFKKISSDHLWAHCTFTQTNEGGYLKFALHLLSSIIPFKSSLCVAGFSKVSFWLYESMQFLLFVFFYCGLSIHWYHSVVSTFWPAFTAIDKIK